MHVVFYQAPGKHREESIREAVVKGIRRAGDSVVLALNSVEELVPADVAVMVGMKAYSLRDRCVRAGTRVIILDKGYDRKEDWWRVSIDAHQPTRYLLDLSRPTDRMLEAGWKFKPWRTSGSFVLIAGGGAKYHSVWNLPSVADWAQQTVDEVRAAGWSGEIQYRPKPSQPDKTVPRGAVLSSPKYMRQALEGAHATTTFGSNACFESVLEGIPCVVTGDAVLGSICSRSNADVLAPVQASLEDRHRVFTNLAYCQFREREWSSGFAWPEIRRQLDEVPLFDGAEHD
jgi:hypothetical protein